MFSFHIHSFYTTEYTIKNTDYQNMKKYLITNLLILNEYQYEYEYPEYISICD